MTDEEQQQQPEPPAKSETLKEATAAVAVLIEHLKKWQSQFVDDLQLYSPPPPAEGKQPCRRAPADMSSEEISDMLHYWPQQNGYANFMLAVYEMALEKYDDDLRTLVRTAYGQSAVANSTKPKGPQTIKMEVEGTREYLDIARRRRVVAAQVRTLKALMDYYQNRYAAVSREITNREKNR